MSNLTIANTSWAVILRVYLTLQSYRKITAYMCESRTFLTLAGGSLEVTAGIYYEQIQSSVKIDELWLVIEQWLSLQLPEVLADLKERRLKQGTY